ncbi:hypothetical protein FRB97_000915 [Tulasnella sp. 331]|nr:hypothetical protein FRB97_000915 [Tulasnella sp. 331]
MTSSACGYSTPERQAREEKKKALHSGPNHTAAPGSDQPWLWHVAYNFSGCLAHADITYRTSDRQILRITGILNHNQACQHARLVRRPAIPLHPQVYNIALKQLQDGASLQAVKITNQRLISSSSYAGLRDDPQFRNARYLILRTDSSRLYRALAHLKGIKTSQLPEVNIDRWLNPTSSAYQPLLHQAVLHYAPRTSKEGRFEACVVSKEMEEATWNYGHNSQIILDGTFGVCDSRLLLFIVMAVDDASHGVPLAFFLFSAPTGNRQTSAGYNSQILTLMLQKWKVWLEHNGRTFEPKVAITDTDTKERAALLAVFPALILLLCKFHLRQCWTNKRRTSLGSCEGSDYAKQQVKSRLQGLEISLIESTEHHQALGLVRTEHIHHTKLLQYSETKASSEAAVKYLDYLEGYWLSFSLWGSWSLAGRLRAAKAMNRAVEGVLPTTNHLESFNRVLKRGYIRQSEKGGKRLHFDVFFHYLISSIIPAIFEARHHEKNYAAWIGLRFGGSPFLSRSSTVEQSAATVVHPVAWIVNSSEPTTRQLEGYDIARHRRIFSMYYVDGHGTDLLEARCLSSKAIPFDPSPISYILRLHKDGFGSCTCPDFQYHSFHTGACKHLYGLLNHLALVRVAHPQTPIPLFSLPTDREDAVRLWGQHMPPTHPPDSLNPPVPSSQLLNTISTLADLIKLPGTGLIEEAEPTDEEMREAESSIAGSGCEEVEAEVISEATGKDFKISCTSS